MLSIGKVAKASGCKVQTIRYYEQIGLIEEAARSEGNQRFYRASKRRIEVKSLKKWLMVDVVWNRLAPMMASILPNIPMKPML